MYKIHPFEEKDANQILAFMQAHAFITLIGFDGEYPVATQVPVHIHQEQETLKLIGHVMTKTDHCKAFAQNENVLAIFTGAHSYVSAAVYTDPKAASTWNYKTVQAKGKIRMLGKDETKNIIRDLTNSHEDPASSPAAFHKIDDAYIEKHLKAISGFEILVTELKAVFKMSQNHSQENRKAIVADLEQREDADSKIIASEMKKDL